MDILIFVFISYFAAGIVFITREADQSLNGNESTAPGLQHPVLRLTSGLIMMLLWPAFLLGEILEPQPSPMAVRIENLNR